uniref:Uncharacterized protein n=1 Tax=uncultured marine virus TaxID=186617 RepID=A0A0F7L8X9_9VIRU|nr:hypothetical protein [uncultured marine virus]
MCFILCFLSGVVCPRGLGGIRPRRLGGSRPRRLDTLGGSLPPCLTPRDISASALPGFVVLDDGPLRRLARLRVVLSDEQEHALEAQAGKGCPNLSAVCDARQARNHRLRQSVPRGGLGPTPRGAQDRQRNLEFRWREFGEAQSREDVPVDRHCPVRLNVSHRRRP